MRAEGTFTVAAFVPVAVDPAPEHRDRTPGRCRDDREALDGITGTGGLVLTEDSESLFSEYELVH